MNLSISNIAWDAARDADVYRVMRELGFAGLEIAPTRIFPDRPYEKCREAAAWAEKLASEYGFRISSMQSIWFGRQERLFGPEEERAALADYTKRAIRFAEAVGCGNLVFGCPRNRSLPEGADPEIAVTFFKELGDYAFAHHTVIGMEANPPIYHTNYINDTPSALALIEQVDSKGFLLNLDVGTMLENGEDVSALRGKERWINHVHISEPGLKKLKKRKLHDALARLLNDCGYQNYLSIEVGRQDSLPALGSMMKYVKSVFGANS